MLMLLQNHTQEQYIGVEVGGRLVQVGPGQNVEVPDTVGTGLLANYSYILRKIETDADKTALLQKEKANLLDKLANHQESIKVQDKELVKLSTKNAELEQENAELKEALKEALSKIPAKEEEKEDEPKEDEATEEEQKAEAEAQELAKQLEETQALYKEVIGTDAPKNKKNDLAWMKGKIEAQALIKE